MPELATQMRPGSQPAEPLSSSDIKFIAGDTQSLGLKCADLQVSGSSREGKAEAV